MKQREPRLATLIPARVRTDDGWQSVTIRNVSPHGAMLQLHCPAPSRGTYVELRRATSVVVGRIVWSAADRCGIATRERIDIEALRRAPTEGLPTGTERRVLSRPPRHARDMTTDIAKVKRMIETLALLAAAIWAAGCLGGTVYHMLARPDQIAAAAMATAAR